MPGQCFLDCLDAKVGLQRDRHPPGKDTAGEPVDDSRKIDEATRHRDVGDVHRPDLIGPNDLQVAQKVGVDFVPGGRFRGVGYPIQCPNPHALHQRCNVQSTDFEAFLREQTPQHPAAREGQLHVQLVDPVHQFQIGVRDGTRLIIDAAATDPQHTGLSVDTEF